MPETRVVNMRKEAFDVYIGRGRGSPWGNPYSHRAGTLAKYVVLTPGEAITRYEAYLRNTPELLARLHELKGKRLGCWCKPNPCHGDVLVKLVEEFCP